MACCVFPPEPWQGHCLLQSDFNDQSSAVWINTLLGFHAAWNPHCLDSTLLGFHSAQLRCVFLAQKSQRCFSEHQKCNCPVHLASSITIKLQFVQQRQQEEECINWNPDQDWGSSSKNGCYSGIWCTMFGWCHSLLCRPRLLNVKHSIGETFGKLILRLRGEWWFALWSPSPSIFRAFQVLLIWSQWWNWFGLNSIMIWGTKIA